jgi:uncharacterized membrane protein
MAALYFFLFFAVAIDRYYSFTYFDWDLAVYDQIIWNLISGRGHSSLLGVNFLGHHAHFLAFPVAFIYKFFPHPLTLMFLQTLALAGAAFPLYYLGRRFLGCWWAVLVCLCYLLYHGVAYANLYEFHFTCFVPVILFSFLYFFVMHRYLPFLVTSCLALFCQENISLILVAFSFYAAILGRSLKWWLPLLLVGVAYFIFCVRILFPALNPDVIQFISIYSAWGRDYGEILKNLFTHPLDVYSYIVTPKKLSWLMFLLSPLSYIPFLSPFALFPVFPVFLQRLLSQRPQETMLQLHYSLEFIPFLFFCFILGLKNLFTWCYHPGRRFLLAGGVLFITLGSSLIMGPFVDICYSGFSIFNRRLNIKEKFLDQIPQDAAVVATFEFLPHLSKREKLYSFHSFFSGRYILSNKTYSITDKVDYGLINFDDPFMIGSFYTADAYKRVQCLLEEKQLRSVDVINNDVFFKREALRIKPLFEELSVPPHFKTPFLYKLEEVIELQGYDLARNGDFIDLSLYWAVLLETSDDLNMVFDFVNEAGVIVRRQQSPMCYRIFPTQAWHKDKWVVDHKYLLVPVSLRQKGFSLNIRFYKMSDRSMVGGPITLKVLEGG